MIQDIGSSYSSQFGTQLLKARKQAIEDGLEFDPMTFSALMPEVPQTAEKGNVTKTESKNDYSLTYLGDSDRLTAFRRDFDLNKDGKVDFLEYVKNAGKEDISKTEDSTDTDLKAFTELISDFEGGDLMKEMIEVMFDRHDKDHNGILDPQELESAIVQITEEIERKLKEKEDLKMKQIQQKYKNL